MRFLMVLLLSLMSMTAFAQSGNCDMSQVGNVTVEQKQLLTTICLNAQKSNEPTQSIIAQTVNAAKEVATPENLTQFGRVSREFAEAIGVAAKELGIAANDFLDTPAGKLTAVVILWKVMGTEAGAILSYVTSFFVGILLLCILWYFAFKFVKIIAYEKIIWEEKAYFFGLMTRRVAKETHLVDGTEAKANANVTAGIVYAASSIVTMIISFNMLIP